MKPYSSCEESAVLGLLVGVEVIPSDSLWVGAGCSMSMGWVHLPVPGGPEVELRETGLCLLGPVFIWGLLFLGWPGCTVSGSLGRH